MPVLDSVQKTLTGSFHTPSLLRTHEGVYEALVKKAFDLIGQGRGLTERLLLTLGMKNLGASSVIVRIARGD